VRPLTWPVYSALLTARCWRTRDNYIGDWIFYARRAEARAKDAPTPYATIHYALLEAERRAGLPHERYRALHGGRRHVVSEMIELTGDRMLGLEYVGDVDAKALRSYDRRVSARIAKAATALDAQEQNASATKTPIDMSTTIGDDLPAVCASSSPAQPAPRDRASSHRLFTTKRHWTSIFRAKANPRGRFRALASRIRIQLA
jgi:hypothetical protein